MHAEMSVAKFGHVDNILREKARILGVNEEKQIVKCKYHIKNAKFESALIMSTFVLSGIIMPLPCVTNIRGGKGFAVLGT